MDGFFNPEGSVMRALSRVADLAILNVLWLVCSIPVVTMGASTTAFYSISMKMVRDEESYIIRGFFKAFKENFKDSTLLWAGCMIILAVLGGDFYIFSHWDSQWKYPMLVLLLVAFIVFVFMYLYLFPLIAKFKNSKSQYLKNAFFMSIRHLPYSIVLMVVFGCEIYANIYILENIETYLPLGILFGFSLFAYAKSWIMMKVFKPYLGEE